MTFKRQYAFFIRVYLKGVSENTQRRNRMTYTKQTLQQDLAAMGLTGTETILIHSSMKAIGVVEGGADTVLDVCIAGAEFCKPIRMQRYLCGSRCTAGVFLCRRRGSNPYSVSRKGF